MHPRPSFGAKSWALTCYTVSRLIGAPHLLDGISKDGQIEERARTAVMREMRQHFRPEFLNRVDEIVLFKPLQLGEIKRIEVLLMAQLQKRLADRRIELTLTDAAAEHVAKQGYDPVYGARPLKRFLQRELETKLGRKLIGGEIVDGARVVVDLAGDVLVFRVEAPVVAEV